MSCANATASIIGGYERAANRDRCQKFVTCLQSNKARSGNTLEGCL